MSQLTAKAVEGFILKYLLPGYDQSRPVKEFHREWLRMTCLDDPKVAIAAPRGHSKTATINHGFSVASAALRFHPYQVKISSTRDIAIEFLQTDKRVFLENEEFQQDFGFVGLSKDTEDDFIADFDDGYQCRMRAYGAEQRMRGIKWGTRRPSLVLADDMEDDEQVLSMERREKLRKWMNRVVLNIGTDETRYRVVGTILHRDSLLNRMMTSAEWISRIYSAHDASFDNILWPELFPRERLEKIRRGFVADHDLIGYNMEFRNIAVDLESGFFQTTDFIEMPEAARRRPHTYYVGGDLAISLEHQRDRTCFWVAGVDPEGYLDVVDVRRGHWDSKMIVDEMFSIQDTYEPDEWYVEDGTIKKAMGSYLELRMRQEQKFINLAPKTTPTANKMSRARPLQGRMRQHAVRFDKNADWYADLEGEMLNFRGGTERNDIPDAGAWLGIGLQRMIEPPSADEMDEIEWQQNVREHVTSMGRSPVTGY